MTNPTTAVLQAKADAVAAQFNRILQRVHSAPATVEKVVMLHVARDLFEQVEAGSGPGTGMSLENSDGVRAALNDIEATCRTAGLFEMFADLSRAERRRLKKLAGEI